MVKPLPPSHRFAVELRCVELAHDYWYVSEVAPHLGEIGLNSGFVRLRAPDCLAPCSEVEVVYRVLAFSLDRTQQTD